MISTLVTLCDSHRHIQQPGKMASIKNQLEGRSSSCFRKYRIFFIFVSTILCVQIYLAYSFLRLEDQSRKSSQRLSKEIDLTKMKKNEGLPKSSRQLKLPPDKQNNQVKTMTQNHSNRTIVKLDPESLNFTPICKVTGKEAVSAVSRAHTQLCKEKIVNITCMSQMGMLYPERLYASCPHSTGFNQEPVNLGCFKDDKTQRLLSGHYSILKRTNSAAQCAFLCLQSGYPYAGTEYSIECFCGMEEPLQLKRLPDSSCNMDCPGDLKQSCGGYLTINVYHTGIQRFKAQEARNSSIKTGKEKPVRIAFLLTVNGRASRQVKRLINILYDPSHFYYIHVDARQDYMYREMLKVEKSCSRKNIKVAKGQGLRHASIWGGASLLTTFLTSAQQMLQYSKDWEFLVNLSESDFPVKSNAQLIDFLTLNRGLNFVKSHGREVQRFITKQGLDKTFVECEARMWRLGDRQLPKGIQIDGGSDWMALSRDLVEYVADPNPDSLISGLLQVFKYTLLPAESFFHTALRNSEFCETYVDNNLHVTNWKRKLGCKCQYKAVVDWCGCSPNDFKLEDFSKIKNAAERNLFFARKFEPVVDQKIIDQIEQWLYPEKYNISKDKGHNSYWQSLYHKADLSPPFDDSLLTISHSLARLIYSKYGLNTNHIGLLEVNAYFKNDQFQGILISAEANIKAFESSTFQNDFPERIESLVKLKSHFTIARQWSERIRLFAVGTDYDQKEQMFRNFVGSISPISSPVLLYEFDASLVTPRNVSVLWIDPNGSIEDINHLQIEEMSLIGSIKPQLEEPLLIGKWRVFLMTDTALVGHVAFLVTPLSFWKNRIINQKRVGEIHNGPFSKRTEPLEIDKKWLTNLKKANVKLQMNNEYKNVNLTEHRTGLELNAWIDELVSEFYTIEQVCVTDNARIMSKTSEYFTRCSQTEWSSQYPDTKADIHNLCEKKT